jgi:hypothetical protein
MEEDDDSDGPAGKVAAADVVLVAVEGGTSCTIPFRATTSRVAYAPEPPWLIFPSPPPRPSSMSRRNVGESS